MDGWTILIYGAVGFLGMLSFLKLVAYDVERAAQQLWQSELTARRALARQQEFVPGEVVEGQAA